MVNPLTPYLSIVSFAVKPVLKLGFALVVIGIVMIALGYDPIGLAFGTIESLVRSAIPGI